MAGGVVWCRSYDLARSRDFQPFPEQAFFSGLSLLISETRRLNQRVFTNVPSSSMILAHLNLGEIKQNTSKKIETLPANSRVKKGLKLH